MQAAFAPSGTPLGSLLWTRAMTAPHHTYIQRARTGRRLTYAETRHATDRWAALLDDLDVPPGAVVGLLAADPLDFALGFLGIMAAGRVVAPLDPGAPDPELAAACDRLGTNAVVADRPGPAGVAPEWVVLAAECFALADGRGPSRIALPPPGGLRLATSGTTGVPKRIQLGDRQLLHTAAAVAAHHGLSATDRGFCPLPLFHVNAEVVGLLATLVAGSTVVLDDRFHRGGFWEAVRGATWINAVPAVLARLVPLRAGESVPHGIRFARSASAPLPLAVLERFERETGIAIVETYGMTEAGSQITANPLDGPRKPGSVGLPVGIDLRVVPGPSGGDGDGEEDGDGDGVAAVPKVGQVEIRGPGVVSGSDAWLSTGDVGYLDDDGYLFLVGRADDVINRGGEKIYPREVEEVLLADPEVAAAVVVPGDHEVLHQVPVAFVVLSGLSGDPAADRLHAGGVVSRLQERCDRALARAKRPAAFHVLEQLPAGATGKVRRKLVRQDGAFYSVLAG